MQDFEAIFYITSNLNVLGKAVMQLRRYLWSQTVSTKARAFKHSRIGRSTTWWPENKMFPLVKRNDISLAIYDKQEMGFVQVDLGHVDWYWGIYSCASDSAVD